MRAPLAALLLLAPALAGCASPPPSPPPSTTFDTTPLPMAEQVFSARAAAEASLLYALERHRDATLIGLEGQETNSTNLTAQYKLRSLGVPLDPYLGDGLLGGWGVRFNTSKGVVRVTALANGSLELEAAKGASSREGEGALERWAVDSPQAAAVALADTDFRAVATTPDAFVSMDLVPPRPTYANDPVKRVFAVDPYWGIIAYRTNVPAEDDPELPRSVQVLVNARTGQRIYNDPFGTVFSERYAHQHVAFGLFISGERVPFTDPVYDASNVTGKVHLNVSEPNGGSIWHLEGLFQSAEPNLTLARVLRQYGIRFNPGLLILDRQDGHNGTGWPDEPPFTWRVFVSNSTGGVRNPFQPVGNSTSYVLRDLDKVLITYGDLPREEIERQQALIPEPPREHPT